MLRRFLTQSKDPEKAGVFWNMLASMLVAFQSVIMLMVIPRALDQNMAGIFTMGNADANLFLMIGKYGMRNFQVSDVKREYDFAEYRRSRIITTAAMALISVCYVVWTAGRNSYTAEKMQIIFWMCLFKLPDAYEDIYYGDYQRSNRLDIGSKALALRMIITIALFALLVVVTRNMMLSVIIVTAATTVLCALFIRLTESEVGDREKARKGRVWKLLLQTAPLMIGSFLTSYIGVAPKNSIDRFMDNQTQAVYGYISMPVFVVTLLNTFIFNPMLYSISVLWAKRERKAFLKKVGIIALFIVGVSALCLAGAWLLGIPVLSFLYYIDLKPYKTDLLLLILGGGFLGMAGYIANILTVMRHQVAVLWGYIAVSVIAFFGSDRVVSRAGDGGMHAAVLFYLWILVILCVIFLLEFGAGMLLDLRKSRQA